MASNILVVEVHLNFFVIKTLNLLQSDRNLKRKVRGFELDNDMLTYPRHEVVMTLIVFVPDSNHQTLLLDGTKIHLVF